jgi:hypothetical protein
MRVGMVVVCVILATATGSTSVVLGQQRSPEATIIDAASTKLSELAPDWEFIPTLCSCLLAEGEVGIAAGTWHRPSKGAVRVEVRRTTGPDVVARLLREAESHPGDWKVTRARVGDGGLRGWLSMVRVIHCCSSRNLCSPPSQRKTVEVSTRCHPFC